MKPLELGEFPWQEADLERVLREVRWDQIKASFVLSGCYKERLESLSEEQKDALQWMRGQLIEAVNVGKLKGSLQREPDIRTPKYKTSAWGGLTKDGYSIIRHTPHGMTASPLDIMQFALDQGWEIEQRIKDHFLESGGIPAQQKLETCQAQLAEAEARIFELESQLKEVGVTKRDQTTAESWEGYTRSITFAIVDIVESQRGNWTYDKFQNLVASKGSWTPKASKAAWSAIPERFKNGPGTPKK